MPQQSGVGAPACIRLAVVCGHTEWLKRREEAQPAWAVGGAATLALPAARLRVRVRLCVRRLGVRGCTPPAPVLGVLRLEC